MPFRIESILVASDLSESARPVLRAAAALAELTEAELHVVHAREPQETEGATEGGAARLRAAEAALQEQLRGAVPGDTVVTSCHAGAGRAHEVVLRRSAEVQADLIVIGAHRGRSNGDRALGTTADRLVRTSTEPCLIVHAPLSLPLRCVLVPSDLSEAAQGALDVALVWGAALRMPTSSGERTTLHVLHVAGEEGGDARERAAGELHGQVAGALERMGGASALKLGEEVLAGESAADEILRSAEQRRADLLVMGTHGSGAGERALIGGVSSTVARRAECPVLLVPPGYWQSRSARARGYPLG